MTQAEMLNEHLNMIYILNEFDLSNIKSKAKEISSTAASGNILKFNRIFDNVKDLSSEKLVSIARKKFGNEYKSSVQHVDKKGKKAPAQIKTFLTLARTTLLKINNDTKDPEIQSKTQDGLKKFDDLLKRVESKGMVGTGISMMALAWIVSFVLGNVLYLAPLLTVTGMTFIAVAIFVYITREIINIFIDAKKTGKKVIS